MVFLGSQLTPRQDTGLPPVVLLEPTGEQLMHKLIGLCVILVSEGRLCCFHIWMLRRICSILLPGLYVASASRHTTRTPEGSGNCYLRTSRECPMNQKIPQLDAVRGIAILLVLIHNTASFPSLHLSAVSSYGWMGVDLFFVLSGFLITGILLDAKQSDAHFRNFFARRCLRIWPLYYSLLILMFLIVPHVRPSDTHEIFEKSSPWWAYPFFLQNFFVA